MHVERFETPDLLKRTATSMTALDASVAPTLSSALLPIRKSVFFPNLRT